MNMTVFLVLSHSNNDYIKQVIATGIPVTLIDHHDPELLADAILSKIPTARSKQFHYSLQMA